MDIAERYVRLAHGIDQHSEGYIDGYGGPPEWADRSPKSPEQLKAQAEALLADVEQIEAAPRRIWLGAQARAMHTMTRLLCGESLPYREEVRGLYDIDPQRAEVAGLDAQIAHLEQQVPGTGALPERLETLRERVVVPRDQILTVAEPILAELRRRTAEKYGLPDGENFSIHLVTDKPWSGYNWPLGNLQSRIDINTDLPVYLPALPELLAHEGYPGHHTEHSGKEADLVRQRGWREHHIQLINAPECVVSEGIATNALDQVMTDEEVESWLIGELAQRAGVQPDDVKVMLDVSRLREGMKNVNGTAALMLHEEGRPREEVLAFLQRYNLTSRERAEKSLEFITHPTFRSYVFNYAVGSELVKGYVAKHGEAGFRELLREPLTPGQLREA